MIDFADMNIFLVLLFVVFVVVAYHTLRILKRTFFVAILSLSFPLILDKVFDIYTFTYQSGLSFMLLGVFLYLIYEMVNSSYKGTKIMVEILDLLFKPFKLLIRKIFGRKNKKS